MRVILDVAPRPARPHGCGEEDRRFEQTPLCTWVSPESSPRREHERPAEDPVEKMLFFGQMAVTPVRTVPATIELPFAFDELVGRRGAGGRR